jgi:succinate dehydrogenase/fumarate reductase flavoprotein subunit
MSMEQNVYDVIVVGSGASGMAAAITAKKNGASVLIVEKESLFGGTTARSGGVLWVPCNPVSAAAGVVDSIDNARTYLRHETGQWFNEEKVDSFLRNGPRMVEFFQTQTDVQFIAVPEFSDYHPDAPGGTAGGRSILAAPFDGRLLGPRISALRPPLREITFVGMMFNASKEVAHFFNVTRSFASACYVARRLAQHAFEMLVHRRAMRLTNGNALSARLAKTAFELDIPLWTSSPVRELSMENGAVTGVIVGTASGDMAVKANKCVILAAGGFPQDVARRKQLFRHAPTGTEHLSPAPPGNTGDGLRLAQLAGADLDVDLPNHAAWIPVSKVLRSNGEIGVFPHLIDRYKPGVIAVTRRGVRFVNEANSYHDVGVAMQQACNDDAETAAYLICDHRTLRRYGMGFVKPFPLPLGGHLRSGYLIKGNTLAELAQNAGIESTVFEATLAAYNKDAVHGEDRQFGRGTSAYNRYLGDSEHKPNPCVGPVSEAPFYAIKTVIGDLGTFAGIRTDAFGRALNGERTVVPGLYAVGNDSVSIMGGNYPGGGITLGPGMTFGFVAGEHAARSEKLCNTRTSDPALVSVLGVSTSSACQKALPFCIEDLSAINNQIGE